MPVLMPMSSLSKARLGLAPPSSPRMRNPPTAVVLYNWRGQWPMRRWEHQRIFAWKTCFPERVTFLNIGFPFNPAWITQLDPDLVMVDATGWSYAMCLDGVATVEVSAEGHQARLEAGQIGRGRNGTVGFEVADVGVDALESEGAVRRQRRLDHTGSFRD